MPRPYRHPVTLLLLSALLLFCYAQICAQQFSRRARSDDFERHQLANADTVRSIDDILAHYRRTNNGRPIPLAALKPGLLRSGTLTADTYFVNSTTGGGARLVIHEGCCVQVASYDPFFRLRNYGPLQTLDYLRRLLYLAGYAAWIVLLVAHLIILSHHRSTNIAHVMILVSLASALLASLRPSVLQSLYNPTDHGNPLWGVLMCTLTLPLFHFRSRPHPDHPTCPTCSYNLTGNLSNVCPECGTSIAPPLH